MGKAKKLVGVAEDLLDPLLRVPARAGGRTGQEVLESSLARQRAILRRAEASRNADRLDALARQRGLPDRHALPKAQHHAMDGRPYVSSARARGVSAEELRLQRDAYQEGMNASTVDETLQQLANKPHRPSSHEARGLARDQLSQTGQRDLIEEGFAPQDARAMAQAFAERTFPHGGGTHPEQITHNPDMHLGGNPHATTHGDGRVNNAFGAMGPQVRRDYEAYLRREQAAGRGDHLVNVEVIV